MPAAALTRIILSARHGDAPLSNHIITTRAVSLVVSISKRHIGNLAYSRAELEINAALPSSRAVKKYDAPVSPVWRRHQRVLII